MKNLNEIRTKAAKALERAQAIQGLLDDENNPPTEQQAEKLTAQFNEAMQSHADLIAEKDKIEQDMQTKLARRQALDAALQNANATAPEFERSQPGEMPPQPRGKQIVVPATVKRFGSVKYLKSEQSAYGFGQWALAIAGNQRSAKWCQDHGFALQTQLEGTNGTGGYLVPEQFENDLIDLREQYGVFRREAKIRPMTSDTRSDPRRTGGLTAYFVGENAQGTKSTKSWDRVQLTAKKLVAIAAISNELNEDAVINIGDDLANEIAYAFSNKEDQCGFMGDGTSTYGGITGVVTKIEADSNLLSHVVVDTAADDTFAELSLSDFSKAIGVLPQYAIRNAKWFVSQYGWANSMHNLMMAAGGNTKGDVAGGTGMSFMGFPVVVSQVLESTGDLSGKAFCLFGDLTLAASFGDRRGTTIEFTRDGTIDGKSMFEYDGIGVRGTERFDINVHDVGSSSAAGPIVALIGGAS